MYVGTYEEWLIVFGNGVRKKQERQNLTRSSLAKLTKTEQGYIVQIERDSRSPSLKTLTNLLTALGVSSDYLIFGTTNKEQSEKSKFYVISRIYSRVEMLEDIKALYQLAAHMLRHKNQKDLV